MSNKKFIFEGQGALKMCSLFFVFILSISFSSAIILNEDPLKGVIINPFSEIPKIIYSINSSNYNVSYHSVFLSTGVFNSTFNATYHAFNTSTGLSAHYVPYVGAITNVDIGNNNFSADWINGKFNWTSADTWNIFNGSTLDFNESKLSTVYYNVSTIQVVTGTASGTLNDINVYDGISYNITESSSDYSIILNFTNVNSLNNIIIRHKSDIDGGHSAIVQLWDYDSGSWESYGSIDESTTYNVIVLGVFDPIEHIQAGVVRLNITLIAGAGFTHVQMFDWVAISEGYGTPSTQEIDPYSLHKDGSIQLTGNWNYGIYNINGSGNITTSGRIGIGAEKPRSLLHVNGSSGTVTIDIEASSANNAGIQFFEANVGKWSVYNQASDDAFIIRHFNVGNRLNIIPNGEMVINDDSADVDFRIESNANANEFFIDAGNNRVGINTNAPGYDIDANATTMQIYSESTPTFYLKDTTNNAITQMYQTNTIGGVGTFTAHDFRLLTADTTRAIIKANGDFGIGLSNPTSRFYVNGSTQGSLATFMAQDNNGTIAAFSSEAAAGIVTIGRGNAAYSTAGPLDVGDAGSISATFTSKVGIGNSSPAYMLTVGGYTDGLGAYFDAGTTSNFIDIASTTGSGGGNSGTLGFYDKTTGGRSGYVKYNYLTDLMTFRVDGVEFVGINKTGMAIGGIVPLYPLQVYGNSTNGVSIWADGNISATDYITRTSVYKDEGPALDKIHNASYYLNSDGSVNHTAFSSYAGEFLSNEYVRTDYWNETFESCEKIFDADSGGIMQACENISIENSKDIYAEKIVQGVSLVEEVALLKQAVYELKVDNENLHKQLDELCEIKLFSWCII